MRWFTSDLHLGDPWAAKLRYCGDDTAKHDAWLGARWDFAVEPDDEVYVLGDLACIGHPESRIDEHELFAWFKARPGKIHVVPGNWDVGYDLNLLPVHSLQPPRMGLVLANGVYATLSHYPTIRMLGDSEVLIHGHTHKREKSSTREDGITRIHVGWDAWRRMVPEADLLTEVFDEREKKDG